MADAKHPMRGDYSLACVRGNEEEAWAVLENALAIHAGELHRAAGQQEAAPTAKLLHNEDVLLLPAVARPQNSHSNRY